jgi:prolyl oligopeptidase
LHIKYPGNETTRLTVVSYSYHFLRERFTRLLWLLLGFGLLMGMAASAQWPYPATETVDAADTYFGRTYKDQYRWLENLQDSEVAAWFKAQATLTEQLLAKIPARDELIKEWTALDKLNPESYTGIRYENGRVFYKKNLGGENIGKLYWRQGWEGEEKVLFDPMTYKPGATSTIQSFMPSWDGRYVALGFSSGGAEYSELRVLDVDKGTLLAERVYPTFEVTGWGKDNKSFFYAAPGVGDFKSLEIGVNHKAKLHRVGTDFTHDIDFLSNKSYPGLDIQPKENPVAYIDESCPNYLVGRLYTVQNEMRMFYAPVPHKATAIIQWKVLCERSDNLVRGFQFAGDYIYAVTHTGAPKHKIVRTRLAHPDWAHAETVVPEGPDLIQSLVKSKHYLIIVYNTGVARRLATYDLTTGQITEIKPPVSGNLVVECPDWRADRCLIDMASWILPRTIYDFDARKNTFAKSRFNSDVSYPGFENLVTEEVDVPGHDGTRIPLSIVHEKGIPLDGTCSCILEGYGAYGEPLGPYFSIYRSVARRGVVLAWAHVRGGGEKGEAWHKAGYKTTKPNTWKDFISCAEYLIKQGYTSPGKMAGKGGSAGGILISRAITERPDLFRAAICDIGDANAMRLEFRAQGPLNTPEFGTVKDPVECQALYEMDGVQHVQRGVKYPAVMGVVGWNDRRVPPWQTGKFVAALQSASASPNPVLMMVNYDSGHFSEEKTVSFRDAANQMAFLLWQTGHKDFQPAK